MNRIDRMLRLKQQTELMELKDLMETWRKVMEDNLIVEEEKSPGKDVPEQEWMARQIAEKELASTSFDDLDPYQKVERLRKKVKQLERIINSQRNRYEERMNHLETSLYSLLQQFLNHSHGENWSVLVPANLTANQSQVMQVGMKNPIYNYELMTQDPNPIGSLD
jgi:hypothetical protein